jgi:hypothetical protein
MFNLIVTCVGGKNYPGPSIADSISDLINHGYKNDIHKLHSNWTELLHLNNQNLAKALDMYTGSLWSASLEAFEEIQGEKHLWIMSCGYGLISYRDPITGYHATFKRYECDSIYNKAYFTNLKEIDVKHQWWDILTNQKQSSTKPKSIHELINNSSSDDFVMIGIKSTLKGFVPAVPKFLEPFVIPYSDGGMLFLFLQKELGSCNKIQLNSKYATWIIREYNRTGTFPIGVKY